MSIDARIELVTYEQDGTATLWLAPRDSRDGPAGQQQLKVLNPKPHMDVLEGMCIWGGANDIMLGYKRWADRIGYTRIKLRD